MIKFLIPLFFFAASVFADSTLPVGAVFNNGQGDIYVIRKVITDKGAFGNVYEVVDQNNRIFALKEFRTANAFSSAQDNLMRLETVFTEPGASQYYLIPQRTDVMTVYFADHSERRGVQVIELMQGDLNDLVAINDSKLKEYTGMDRLTLFNIVLTQLLDGFKIYSKKGFIHRDIKPENILYKFEDGKIQIKFSDFDSMIHLSQSSKAKYTLTPAYLSPEAIGSFVDRNKFDGIPTGELIASDIYAIGLTLARLLLGYDPITHYLNGSGLEIKSTSEYLKFAFELFGTVEKQELFLRDHILIPIQVKYKNMPKLIETIRELLHFDYKSRLNYFGNLVDSNDFQEWKNQNSIGETPTILPLRIPTPCEKAKQLTLLTFGEAA